MDCDLKIITIIIITLIVIIFGSIYTTHSQTMNMANKHYIYINGWYPNTILNGVKRK